MNADSVAAADGSQHRGFGEYFCVWPDADFEVLRPHALFNQQGFQAHGLLGAWNDRAQVVADHRVHGGPHGFGFCGITAGLLFDHALDHAGGKGHSGSLDHLQVQRWQ
ncbi:hypothetical protein D3C84_854620 [compost metagenome]